MVTLYYLNKNNDIDTIELPTFEACIPLRETGLFIAFRDGLEFIKHPPEIFPFTNLERLIIGTEFFDANFIKDSDYRKENTSFCPKLPPLTFLPIITNVDYYGLFISAGETVRVLQSFDGIAWNIIGDEGFSDEPRRNHQPEMPSCLLKLSNSSGTLFSPIYTYSFISGGE